MTTDSTPSSILIRSYQPSDLSACQEIFTAGHRSYDNPMFYINSVLQTDMADIEKNYLQIPNGHWWVAVSTDDNRIVGHVAVLPLSIAEPSYYHELPEEERDQICDLRRMSVATDVQRAGVGRKLLSTLIDFAREKGYRQVHLTTLTSMDRACAFYERNGFIKGRIEKTSLNGVLPEKYEDFEELLRTLPEPIIFEAGAIIPDEDLRLMRIPIVQSQCFYVQHYSLTLQ
jgi:GNAT superfamily N-acetyltransferase